MLKQALTLQTKKVKLQFQLSSLRHQAKTNKEIERKAFFISVHWNTWLRQACIGSK